MNILGNNAGKLNEVIFENRNKNYGAYAIRSSYNDSLMKSLLCISSFVLLLFCSVFVYNKYNKVIDEKATIILDELKNEDLVYEVNMEQPKAPDELPQPHEAAAAKGGVATTIVDETPITATVTNVENPNPGQGSEGSKGTSLTSTVSSTEPSTITISGGGGEKIIPEVIIADEMPEFEGGMVGLMRYVSQNISYPDMAREIGKEGTVHVSFVVNESGNVEGIKVMRGIGYGCDEEVMRVINKMPKWKKGGKNAGHPVKVRFNIPVCFKLR